MDVIRRWQSGLWSFGKEVPKSGYGHVLRGAHTRWKALVSQGNGQRARAFCQVMAKACSSPRQSRCLFPNSATMPAFINACMPFQQPPLTQDHWMWFVYIKRCSCCCLRLRRSASAGCYTNRIRLSWLHHGSRKTSPTESHFHSRNAPSSSLTVASEASCKISNMATAQKQSART